MKTIKVPEKHGGVMIQYRTENQHIVPVFRPAAGVGHIHVTVYQDQERAARANRPGYDGIDKWPWFVQAHSQATKWSSNL